MFRSARPARFHPSGFLSGADEAYSSLHSQFTLLHLIYAKSVGLSSNEMWQPLSHRFAMTAPLPRGASGEEGKRYRYRQRPLLQGEVARRRRDGEVGRRKSLSECKKIPWELNFIIQADPVLIIGPHLAVGDGHMSRVLGVALERLGRLKGGVQHQIGVGRGQAVDVDVDLHEARESDRPDPRGPL